MKKQTLKNYLLLLTPVLSLLHSFFKGSKHRVDWYLFIDYTRRIDYAIMYLTTSINFIIISFVMMYPKGVSVDIKIFILIVCLLDLIHYFTVSKVYFGVYKVFLAVILFYIYKYFKND